MKVMNLGAKLFRFTARRRVRDLMDAPLLDWPMQSACDCGLPAEATRQSRDPAVVPDIIVGIDKSVPAFITSAEITELQSVHYCGHTLPVSGRSL